MQFFSLLFFCLTAAVFGLIFLGNKICKQHSAKIVVSKWILLLASYLFVCYADYRFCLVLAALTVITWFCAKKQSCIKYGILAAILALTFSSIRIFLLSLSVNFLANRISQRCISSCHWAFLSIPSAQSVIWWISTGVSCSPCRY